MILHECSEFEPAFRQNRPPNQVKEGNNKVEFKGSMIKAHPIAPANCVSGSVSHLSHLWFSEDY